MKCLEGRSIVWENVENYGKLENIGGWKSKVNNW